MTAEKEHPYTGEWFNERNKRRKENYHSDPEYREKVNAASRENYREKADVDLPFDPRDNRDLYTSYGKLRQIEGGSSNAELTFTKAELAEVLGRPVKQVQQWAQDGRIPKTVTRAKVVGTERNWLDVYTPAEVVALIDAIGEHLSQFVYYRTDHIDAIRAVHDAFHDLRESK